ncbi:ATP-dependent zinc metalloprotease FtsH [Spirochaeta lutea]|uniref:ATP-dependent zinc metalloprotease FtsH n=1 Tax=Spirochaeta lutea TaxID=1480694 RepID=UPI000560BCFB|nr:ATP-dependent zinc metalloprotease FtsH [Spirochaeta lutea]
MSDNNQNKNNGNQEPRQPNFNFKNNRFALFLVIGLFGLFILMFLPGTGGMGREIPYSQFLAYLEQGEIASVKIIDYRKIEGQLASQEGEYGRFISRIPYTDQTLIPLLKEQGVRFSGEESPISPFAVIIQFLPILIGIVFIWLLFRQVQGGGNKAFTFGKSKAKRYVDVNNDKRISFADVAGQTEAKYELQEVVEFLKNPGRFTRMGAKIPKGVLLVGMPGTGKTLLAKATAGEAGVPFFHMSGSDFVEMFVGVGASRVRDLFDQGRKNAPCILFIDELDAVGRTRGAGYGGGHDEREQTLNQMLVEMDGFDTKDGVIMIAATNRPDVLDPALLRPGRFDRQVVVDMPDMQEREAILKIHASKIPLGKSVDLTTIAKATPGASGADIANLVNESALYAARKNREYVEMEDFEEARDKMLMGVARKSKVISEKDKLATAYHEAGHALLHYYLDNADPLHKVSIVPRGRALGVAISLPDEDKYSRNKGWLQDRIVIAYGGYVAEDLMYGETTTGTQNDLKQATDLARRMVCEWGMSDLGPVSFGQEDEPIFLGKEIATHKDYSEETAQRIDQQISKILNDGLAKARKIIVDNKDKLESLARALMSRETLTDVEVREVVGLEEKTQK